MKELSVAEIKLVSGAGVIQDTFTDVGKKLGDIGFELIGPYLTVDLPLIGTISVADKYPGLGGDIGGQIGSKVGGAIEDYLRTIPGLSDIFK